MWGGGGGGAFIRVVIECMMTARLYELLIEGGRQRKTY